MIKSFRFSCSRVLLTSIVLFCAIYSASFQITDASAFNGVVNTATNKNLFNKSNIIKNAYVNNESGGVLPANEEWSASDYIKIEPGTLYHKNTFHMLAFYDVNKIYISGIGNGTYTFTTPANARYLRMSVMTADIAKAQLELGSVETSYETGLPLIFKEQIKDLEIGTIKNVLVVAKEGGDYSTINDAVKSVKNNEAVTILIMPGTYNESLHIYGGKQISLIGLNKRTTIIRDDTGDYYNAPLNIAGNVYVANLTIIATHDKSVGARLPSYAVHHDFPGEGTSEIYNCILISYQNAAIGIGLQNKQTLIIDSTEMYSTVNAGLFMHPYPFTAVEQKMIVKNSKISSAKDKALSLIDSNNNGLGGSGDNRDTQLSFYNNIFWSETSGKKDVIYGTPPMTNGAISGFMKLTGDSWGNNIPELNSK